MSPIDPTQASTKNGANVPAMLANAQKPDDSPFDYIIVGSGAGGGPLACRLVEAGKKVLLVEAGRDPKEELIENANTELNTNGRKARFQNPDDAAAILEAPLFHGAATEDVGLSWQFSVRHYDDNARQADDHKYDATRDPSSPELDPSQPGSPPTGSQGKGGIFYPRSSGIGGCTGHHAMIVIRPNDSDWEHIAEITNDDSWRAKNMQPYFAKMENCLYLEEYRGVLTRLLGWLYKGVLAFMRFINPKSVLDEGGHGFKGWQPTSFISLKLVNQIIKTDAELTKVLIQSAFKVVKRSNALSAWLRSFLITMGFARSLDPNDAGARSDGFTGGVFLIPLGTGGAEHHADVVDEAGFSLKGRRSSVREFILKTQKAHPGNLVIVPNVQVERVLFDNGATPRAIGIIGMSGQHLYRASPNHAAAQTTGTVEYYARPSGGEVILCGGSFNTPQLLMLSGIGGRAELEKHGINVRVDLPGVGKNLQDRYEVGVISELKDEFKSLDTVAFDPASTADKVLAEWRKDKEGLYTSNGGTLAILQRSSYAEESGPDLFTFGAPASFRGYYWRWSKELLRPYLHAPNDQRNLWTWVILKAYTRNNGGTVRLRSADPLDTPDICFHSFDEGVPADKSDKDADAIIEAIHTMRALNGQPGSPFKHEIQPKNYLERANEERRARNEREWTLRDWIKNEAWGHHACGTCRIGGDAWQKDPTQLADKLAVLDSHFKVHGVRGLRVVDASVFPKIPGYFILAPIFMVSEKAADTILLEACNENYPESVRQLEENAIHQRRAAAWVNDKNEFIPPEKRPVAQVGSVPQSNKQASNAPPPENVVGLALSGGGIRSATFALGVLQALAEKGRLRQIDYLSTISGGGFTGSFLGRLFTRPRVADAGDPVGRAQEILKQNNSGPLRWLRVQANYLFASGTDDWRTTLAIFFRNLIAVHLVIGALLLALFGLLAGISRWSLYQKLVPHPPGPDKWLGFTPSAWWWLPLAVLALVIVPMKLGYWLAPKNLSYRSHPPHPLAAWLILIGGAAAALTLPGGGKWAGAVLVVLALAWVWQDLARHNLPEDDVEQRRPEGAVVRNRLSRGLGEAIIIFLVLVAGVVLDSIADTHAVKRQLPKMIGALVALSPALGLLRSWAMAVLPKGDGPSAFTLVKIAAVLLAAALLFLVDVIAHSLFSIGDLRWAWGGVLVAFLFSAAFGRAFDFLNFTSLSAAYCARIIRTFLGASNDARTVAADNIAADVSVTHPDDDLPHFRYRPEEKGGPLHLISVCVNETVDHASQREIRESKGLLMTVGSFGVSVGRRYFAKWTNNVDAPRWLRFRRWLEGLDQGNPTPPALEAVRIDADPGSFHPLARRDGRPAVAQPLSLGEWVAVSGAAFSTGRGRASNPLEALFMGLLNVRLGLWWDSGILATERPGRFPANVWRRLKEIPGALFRSQQLLLSEWRARFDGPSHEFWNLSDGGHQENSGVYELVRRRVPFIIATDASTDPDYSYEDLANLLRCVRVDFGVEVRWLDPAALPLVPPQVNDWVTLGSLGTLEQIEGNRSKGGPGQKHAALARITYPDAQESWLLLIKTSLVGDETLDITQYARANGAFPQDSIADQVFDDAQWESYRKLGHLIGDAVLRPAASVLTPVPS